MTTNRNGQHSDLDERSLQLRRIIVRMLEGGGRGHVGSALSLVEILRVLYDDVLQYDPHNPNWLDRDRFILSKGQGCLALYAVLADKGFFPDSELDRFCHSEGLLGGHPEIRVPGIEASTGSLGHGLAIGIGFALNAKYENSDYRTFVAIGDGESNEGSIWEGAMCASKHGLSNLTVLVDYNKQQSYGSTYEVQDLEPVGDKWRAFGFGVAEVDGHDVDQIRSVLTHLPVEQGKPTTVVCHTVKGKGIDYVEGNLDWHHKNRLSDDDISALKLALEAG
jgi:transketolase